MNFVCLIAVIESTKDLSLLDEKQRSPTKAHPRPFTAPSTGSPRPRRPPLPGSSRGNSSSSSGGGSGSTEAPDCPLGGLPPPNAAGIPVPPSYDPQKMVALAAGQLPVPAKCSQQFRKLIHSHSLSQAQQVAAAAAAAAATSGAAPAAPQNLLPAAAAAAAAARLGADLPDGGPLGPGAPPRPILPHLPYSPYGSPSSSPRVKRKPLRETRRVDSVTKDGPQGEEYVQLNQYKLSGVVGQVSLIIFLPVVVIIAVPGVEIQFSTPSAVNAVNQFRRYFLKYRLSTV